MKICDDCGSEIPRERLEALPNTEYCAGCADHHTPEYAGFMIYEHKTGGYLARLDKSKKEIIRQAERANRRAR